jgi:hypothetical protein
MDFSYNCRAKVEVIPLAHSVFGRITPRLFGRNLESLSGCPFVMQSVLPGRLLLHDSGTGVEMVPAAARGLWVTDGHDDMWRLVSGGSVFNSFLLFCFLTEARARLWQNFVF